jgi:tRNA pseudouridine38-40 synthase
LTVAYDGEGFCGFAPQREGRTIHGVLSAAVQSLDPDVSPLRGASRTDAGVHARGQVVAFDPSRDIPCKGWVLGVNAALPRDVAVQRAEEVEPGFEPRAKNHGKRYRYRVMVDRVRDPLLDQRAWRVDPPFDRDRAMAEAAAMLGTHDFRAFRSSADERQQTIRTLNKVELRDVERGFEVVVEGSAFLHNMVRIMVGTLVDVGRGRLAAGAVARALGSGDRSDLGMTAPAHGLCLDEVFLELDGSSPEGSSWP